MSPVGRQAFTDLNDLRLEFELEDFKSELLYWGFFDGSAWWRNYLHVHSFFEICYVLGGEGEFRINDQLYPLGKHDLFIAKPGERHEIVSSESRPLSIYFWSYTLIPQRELKGSDLNTLLTAFKDSRAPLAERCMAVSTVLASLTAEIDRKAIGYPTVVEGLVKQLLIETARAGVQGERLHATFANSAHRDRAVTTIIHYLRDNYKQALSLREIAAQVNLSERHMSRRFKEVTGQTVKQYITGLRIDAAKQLLSSNISVSEVAYETGYGDVRHFSTVFRKWAGLSPSQYRANGGTEFLA